MIYQIVSPKNSAVCFVLPFIVLIFCAINVGAQGFDWQYSSRLPSGSPTLFWGGGAKVNYGFHSADIYTLGEEYRCGDYKLGKETGFSLALAGEYWETGALSVWGEAGYRFSSVTFSSIPESQPFKLGGVVYALSREFQMKAQFHAIELQAGIKWRFAPTHFHILAGVRGTLALKNTVEQTETILTPIEFTQAIQYGQTSLAGIRTFYLTPLLGIGYDAELGRGMYATPKVTIGLPLMSHSPVTSWESWDYSLGIVVLTHF